LLFFYVFSIGGHNFSFIYEFYMQSAWITKNRFRGSPVRVIAKAAWVSNFSLI